MNMVNILYTTFEKPLDETSYSAYISLLSPELREKNSRYVRWQNRHSHLFGKLLLIEALKRYGIEGDIWNSLGYNSQQRPCFTSNEFDFNITHSGNYVACAIGKHVRLGIDIEENRNVDLKNFQMLMTPGQWSEIYSSSYPLKEFYKYWTIKESVIKADGRGFVIPLEELHVRNATVQYDDKLWFVQELQFTGGYNAALATDQLSEIKVHEVDFYNPRSIN